MSADVERRIGALAARQHGVITQVQLLQCGLSCSGVHRRLQSGRLQRLHRGVYLAAPFPLPHTREMAAVLAIGAEAVVSHRSAAALWGVYATEKGHVEVSAATHHQSRRGLRTHRAALGADERTVRDGIPVTTPARTLWDLARVLERRQLESVVARAERERLVTEGELERLLARRRGKRGASALAAVVEMPGAPALTRSEAEVRFLELVREAGLPPPECNVGLGAYELDFYWRKARIAVEVDGFQYHAVRRRFEGDRRKDTQLLARGIKVVRVSWKQITEERMTTAVQLALALGLALGRSDDE